MNYLWGGMILIGIIYGTMTGNLGAVTEAAVNSSREAISVCIVMAGVTAMWVGMMRIAENAGLVEGLMRKMNPILAFLFPNIPKDHEATRHIAMNMIANFLGLGWAATPAGLAAMEELARLEEERRKKADSGSIGMVLKHTDTIGEKSMLRAMPRGIASNEMCTFLILNISSLQLIPVNVIAYRSQYGSVNPTAIVGPGILATLVSTAVAVMFCKAMDCKKRRV